MRILASCCWSLNFCDMPILTHSFKILEHDSLAQDRRKAHKPSVQLRSSTLYLISLKTCFLETEENYENQESYVFDFKKYEISSSMTKWLCFPCCKERVVSSHCFKHNNINHKSLWLNLTCAVCPLMYTYLPVLDGKSMRQSRT